MVRTQEQGKLRTFGNQAELTKLEPVPDEDERVVDARIEATQHAVREGVATICEVRGMREDIFLDSGAGALLLEHAVEIMQICVIVAARMSLVSNV